MSKKLSITAEVEDSTDCNGMIDEIADWDEVISIKVTACPEDSFVLENVK